jgi:ectoine hydroxylase
MDEKRCEDASSEGGVTMDAACLRYGLTEEERRTFNETGLLTVEEALSPTQVAALTEALDRIYEQKLSEGHEANKSLFFPNFIPKDDLFLDLVDYERVLPKVWGILGWNI